MEWVDVYDKLLLKIPIMIERSRKFCILDDEELVMSTLISVS